MRGEGRTLFYLLTRIVQWPYVKSEEKVRRVLTNPPPLTVTGYHYKAQLG